MIRLICWPVAKGVAGLKKVATATRPIRRYRRARRAAKVAGAVTLKTTARKVGWLCIAAGPLLVTPAIVPPLFVVPSTVPPVSAERNDGISFSGNGLAGSASPLALLPPGAGSDEFFTLAPGHAADLSLPPGTVEIVLPPTAFTIVPDCCSPHPSLPQPGNPETSPQPVPEPRSLLLLGTALAVTMLATMWRA